MYKNIQDFSVLALLILLFVLSVDIALIPSHCCAANPMKNLSHNVRILIKIVTVAAISPGTPTQTNNVVSVISGRPTSKGTPIGMDFAAVKIA